MKKAVPTNHLSLRRWLDEIPILRTIGYVKSEPDKIVTIEAFDKKALDRFSHERIVLSHPRSNIDPGDYSLFTAFNHGECSVFIWQWNSPDRE